MYIKINQLAISDHWPLVIYPLGDFPHLPVEFDDVFSCHLLRRCRKGPASAGQILTPDRGLVSFHRCPRFQCGWLMKKEGLETSPFSQQVS